MIWEYIEGDLVNINTLDLNSLIQGLELFPGNNH